ncbi:MAG: hypothetical protein ABR589_02495 [Chthoniobacterales bacterium]
MKRVTLFTVVCGCSLAAPAGAVEVELFPAGHTSQKSARAAQTQYLSPAPARAVAVKSDAVAAPEAVRAVEVKPVVEAARATLVKSASQPVRAAAVKLPVQTSRVVAVKSVTSEAARAVALNPTPVAAAPRAVAGSSDGKKQFTFKDRSGKVVTAPVLSAPVAKIDRRLNPTLMRAASIAQERAHAHSKSRCWRYVKNALLASGAISSYPKTPYAKQAGEELVRNYGFKKLPIRDPYAAPVGAVLVYGSRRAAGHVEIRTKNGFVSDFVNKKPSPRPLIGVYAKA